MEMTENIQIEAYRWVFLRNYEKKTQINMYIKSNVHKEVDTMRIQWYSWWSTGKIISVFPVAH